MKRHNFTVIEILAVVGIIAILAGITLGIASYVGNKNKETRTQTAIKLFSMAQDKYKREVGAYFLPAGAVSSMAEFYIPLSGSSASAKKEFASAKKNFWGCFTDIQFDSDGNPSIRGLKLEKGDGKFYILDGWGRRMIYTYPGTYNQNGYDFGSKGPDGKFGDTGTESDFGKVDDITNFKR